MYIISVTVAELCICGVIYDQATNNKLADQTHHKHVFGVPNSGIFAEFLVCLLNRLFLPSPSPLPENNYL